MKRRINKMKLLTLIIFTVMIVTGISVTSVIAQDKKTEPLYKYYTTVQLEFGDTLWSIAQEYNNGSMSISDYIAELRRINNISDDNIFAGKNITVIYYSDEYK